MFVILEMVPQNLLVLDSENLASLNLAKVFQIYTGKYSHLSIPPTNVLHEFYLSS